MTTDNLPKACVILGAGASHDVHDDGSIIINAAFKPPLARDLFDITSNPAYWEVLEQYPGAVMLTQALSKIVPSGEASVEEGLRRYASHDDPRMREHFKYIPPYLRDLMYKATYEYTKVPSCYVQLTNELLMERPHEVLFLVLNYDMLLENSLSLVDRKWQFGTMWHYIEPERQAKVVKLHGSINWFRKLGRGTWEDSVTNLELNGNVEEHEIVLPLPASRRDFRYQDEWIYPVLTAPMAGKGQLDLVCPDSHIEVARVFLAECHKFLIIGSSGLDNDLLSLLDSALEPSEAYDIDFVGYGDDTASSWLNYQRTIGAFNQAYVVHTTRLFDEGFRQYVSRNSMKEFVSTKIGA